MTIEERIAAKKAQRAAAGLAFRITFDSRPEFNAYYADKATFDENHAIAVASIGKRDRHGFTALSVEIL